MEELWTNLSFAEKPAFRDEASVYQGVTATIRALAQVGRVVVVGRGSVYVTRNLPGGLHVRLIAPLDYRIRNLAKREAIHEKVAAIRVAQLDRNRAAFYKRYWPSQPQGNEAYDLTINTASVPLARMVDVICAAIGP